MIGPPLGTRVYLACGVTDMRAGMDRLATLVQQSLGSNPFDGTVYLLAPRCLVWVALHAQVAPVLSAEWLIGRSA
jgi:transposase